MPENIPVTAVTTAPDAADDLKPSDYRDIYDELRSKAALRVFVEMLSSQYSIAWWSKYERGEGSLTRAAKQELRHAVGLAPLPPTVAEACTAIDPAAVLYQVGQAPATRVVMVGRDAPALLTLHLNGRPTVEDASDNPDENAHVTPVTRPLRGASRSSIVLTRGTWERLNQARLRANLTWEQFLAPLLG